MSDEEKDSDSDDTTSTSSSSSDDDDDDQLIDEQFQEKDFLKTLSCLKNKDPSIYDENVHFFNETTESTTEKRKKKPKDSTEEPMYIRDYERDILTKKINDSNEESDNEPPPSTSTKTYNEQQKELKESFRNIIDAESSEDEDNSNLLKKKVKDEKEKQEEEEDYIQWLKGKKEKLEDEKIENDLKPLHDYWNNPNLDEKEQFLRDYILNKRYLEKDSMGNYDGDDLSEDEKILEEQEDFELNYKDKLFYEDNTTIKRYPRNIEGSLRRKDDTRKKKREEIKERKREEKEKKKLDIKKKQKEKLNEIKEKLQKLKEITGNAELGFKDEEIMEDFDPEMHDKRMQELYNEQFYSENVDEKPDFSNQGDDEWNIDDINMDCEAEDTDDVKETRSKKKRKKRKKAFTDICDVVKPLFDPDKHSSYQKYIDEFYNLDCEDFIDDIPCRFKYREVVPNDYGLSVEEILLADDKELNQWVSSKKICKLQPKHVEKNEVKIYKEKSKDDKLKMKLLPSLFKDDEEENDEEDEEKRNISTAVDDGKVKKRSKNKRKTKNEDNVSSAAVFTEELSNNMNEDEVKELETQTKETTESGEVEEVEVVVGGDKRKRLKKKRKAETTGAMNSLKGESSGNSPVAKKKKKWQNENRSKDPLNKITDNRLLAYNIKPREFRSKLKHSNTKHKK
ncbi:hypothetical protein O3M35_001151 [Rhynocoris fuscipes]|uniref:Protein KRI1 homolog n=1 Tax=Rhynocoris fuscipes TaxID=488301 RepID=A0AAW1DP94_9HEMI